MITFKSHTNLGVSRDVLVEKEIDQAVKQMSISGPTAKVGLNATARGEAVEKTRGKRTAKGKGKDDRRQYSKTASSKRARRVRGKGNCVNQFCIYKQSEGPVVPVVAIEYKSPHKLTVEKIVAGLASEIHPASDVIN